MPQWPILHQIGAICGSSTFFQVVGIFLWDIFALFKIFLLHEHLNLVAFHHFNCCSAEILKNIFCWLGFFKNCKLVIFHLLLNIFIVINWRWLGIFVHPNHHVNLITPTWIHFQLNSNTHSIIYEQNIFNMARQVQICIQKLIYSPSFIVEKYCPELLSLNTYFTNQWKYKITNFAKIILLTMFQTVLTFFVFKCLSWRCWSSNPLFFFNKYAKLAIFVPFTLVEFISNIFLSCCNHLSMQTPHSTFI